jgi:hypothetical protein
MKSTPKWLSEALFQQINVNFQSMTVLQRVIVVEKRWQRGHLGIPAIELRYARHLVIEPEVGAEEFVTHGHELGLALGIYRGIPIKRGLPKPSANPLNRPLVWS